MNSELLIGIGIGLLLIGLLVLWLLKKPKTSLPVSKVERASEILPQSTPSLPSKAKWSKAFTSWLPLLSSASKDREQWEEALIRSDMGPKLADQLLGDLLKTDMEPKSFFVSRLKEILRPAQSQQLPWESNRPWVCFVVGVNGVGKTSTIVKLGAYFKQMGKKVGVVGADTFRKAAIEQIERGCKIAGIEFFSEKKSDEESEGVDPSSVIFDGLKHFAHCDMIFVDTSGRLHTKKNLMEELKKMKRVADKVQPGAPHDVWLVVDSTLGQNLVQQALVFNEAVQLSGLILTKMDGLSKGGVIFQLFQTLQKPIWFMAHGENVNDISPFESENFVEDLFDLRAS